MGNYWKNWNLIRFLRLLVGFYIIVQGVMDKQWWFVLLGGLFALLPLFNIGCCGTSGCKVPINKTKSKEDLG